MRSITSLLVALFSLSILYALPSQASTVEHSIRSCPVHPFNGINSYYHAARPNGRKHKGIDLEASNGTRLYAAETGKIVFAGRRGGYGRIIKLQGNSGTVYYYAHLSQYLVSNRTQVKVGQAIAKAGNSGTSTGAHLHFEIHPNGKDPVNPLPYIRAYCM